MPSSIDIEQPTIVFTPSTPIMSAIPAFHDIEIPLYQNQEEAGSSHTSRRKSFYRSFSTPMIQPPPSPRKPIVLHRPRSSSPTGAQWSLTRARQALFESCWGSERTSRAAVATGIMEDCALKERRNVGSRDTSGWGVGREKGPWCDMDDDDELSEPELSPSTPVFVQFSGLPTSRHSSRFITLTSTLVIALALAALAFTTFFHPTFGDKISNLPTNGEGHAHRFIHFDGLFGHSDDDGLIGISSTWHSLPVSGGINDELRKRAFSYSASPSNRPVEPVRLTEDQDAGISNSELPTAGQIDNATHNQKRWNPWTASRVGAVDTEDNAITEHRRSVGAAERRLMKRKEALARRTTLSLVQRR
ncbi:hypothetical protein QFC19_001697 [Naganishia cerealis]|uniref:Uncharacterized protein n=1 Tax=Naganishia cerealis TaxID=610337 RepID=A0ACC2WGK8_9TREE|nr:hypothetical protein QFC19_001697 [Naganishia cerealis]